MATNRDLEQRVQALERRLDLLEAGRSPSGPAGAPSPRADQLWAVEVLQGRHGPPFEVDDARGSIVYAGALETAATGSLAWQIERPLPALLDHPWDLGSGVLAALSHPVRLEILRRLLGGMHTSQELQSIANLGTSGQLYHHLRELQAHGLIVSPRRNQYLIPAQKIVPCLVIVAAAAELGMQSQPVGQEE